MKHLEKNLTNFRRKANRIRNKGVNKFSFICKND